MEIRIREEEGVQPDPFLLWDCVFDQINLDIDWVLAGSNAPLNSMGLQALKPLDTAIILSLFTWRRAEEYDLNPTGGSDPKGWWGDAVDLEGSEGPLGSRLWLLFRSKLDVSVAEQAVAYCYEALQPLVTQGAVASFNVDYTLDQAKSMLGLIIQAYSQNGQLIYSQQFDRIWRMEFS